MRGISAYSSLRGDRLSLLGGLFGFTCRGGGMYVALALREWASERLLCQRPTLICLHSLTMYTHSFSLHLWSIPRTEFCDYGFNLAIFLVVPKTGCGGNKSVYCWSAHSAILTSTEHD